MTSLSILDLVRVTQNTDARGAFDNARDLAAHAERWGYHRFWVAEHHNMPGVASAATAVVLSHIAAGTRTIRVGADPGAAIPRPYRPWPRAGAGHRSARRPRAAPDFAELRQFSAGRA
jgi:alkanesulfonate monooxygenase SsuD/methylene tetrahydromethanopterin reductase-like flavin-dependent oxidoreductase (luciferase family)